MRAAFLRMGGGVCVREVDDPRPPGAGEVGVAMRLAPVNPADLLAADGRYAAGGYTADSPLGAEGIGVVETVGPDITGLEVGTRVLPLDRGNWVERRTIFAERLVHVPEGLTDEQAAVLRINPATAFRLLDRASLSAGDWLVQSGATSMVGRLVVALARQRGVRSICVVRDRDRAAAALARLDPDAILLDDETLLGEVAARTSGAWCRLALDCVAGAGTGRLAQCLAPGGHLTVFGHLSGQPCSIPSPLLTGRGISLDGFSLRPDEGTAARRLLQPLFNRLGTLLADQPALLPAFERYPLDRLDAAMRHAGPGRALIDFALA